MNDLSGGNYGVPPHIHRSLQILIISDESLPVCLFGLSFPCLRLLGIHGHGLQDFNGVVLRPHILAKMTTRSSSDPTLLLSLRGRFAQSMLHRLIPNLPSESHLHLDTSRIIAAKDGDDDATDSDEEIEVEMQSNPAAVYCGEYVSGLSWLPIADPERDETFPPLKIYLPEIYRSLETFRKQRFSLHRYNLELQTMPKEALASKLRSLAPDPSTYSKTWWTF